MTRKTVQVLAAVVVGLVLLLIALRGNHDYDAGLAGQPLLPDFEVVANDVDKLRIARPAGKEGVTLHRVAGKWAVGARDDYPVDVGKLRQLVIALADAKIVEEKTSNPGQYEKLGVGDPEDGGNGTKVVLSAPGFSYAVILGETAQRNFRYARVGGDAASGVIDRNPDVPDDPAGWLLPDIVDIGSADVRRVEIAHTDGETIVIEKTDREQTDFDVAGIPDGRELSYRTVGNGIAGALGKLQLADVRAATDAPPDTTATFVTWSGLEVVVNVFSDGDTAWFGFSANAQPAAEVPDATDGAPETDENADEPPADGTEAAGTRAAAINERVGGWQYKLQDYKKDLLTRRWDDILKAEETE